MPDYTFTTTDADEAEFKKRFGEFFIEIENVEIVQDNVKLRVRNFRFNLPFDTAYGIAQVIKKFERERFEKG